ncbi:DUF3103 domain-containing protein [Pseudoalteromonas ruthenica]|uniref:DUF3103 family protein n=1 Tax=Pseudoalteromonas ruthenica TaxID=151081 RepID=UPI0011087382|nr:DUF3103 family protein [Pseudoalteromonas ruthenica]TLX50241.1 DUF3103 domain-containing protein [Pseudoalteromonas ruthenica]
MKKLSLLSLALASTLSLTSHLSVASQTTAATQPAQAAHSVFQSKKALAKNIAKNLKQLQPTLQQQLSAYSLAVSADKLVPKDAQSEFDLQQHNAQIRSLKGLPEQGDNLLQLRLAHRNMLNDWQQGEPALVAFAPKGDDKHWDVVEAYDQQGQLHLLDAYTLPDTPVFIVELDAKKTLTEGLAIMRSVLASTQQPTLQSKYSIQDEQPLSTTVLKQIRLNDDEEPWISGAAEVYAIVTGVSPSRDEPVLDIVDMPYLDHDGENYYPNQVLIHWNRYRWQAADILLMEQDDNTNYKTLASKLLEVATAVLRAIPNPDAQGYAIIPQLTNEILQAMPDAWFTNDDDYVDVYYTLREGQTYRNYAGASNNARVTLEPLTIDPR